jgi:hypothetical protein
MTPADEHDMAGGPDFQAFLRKLSDAADKREGAQLTAKEVGWTLMAVASTLQAGASAAPRQDNTH